MKKQLNRVAQLTKLGNIFLVIVMVFSALGLNSTPALAAPAGTALQFNGTSQYVTFPQSSSKNLMVSENFVVKLIT